MRYTIHCDRESRLSETNVRFETKDNHSTIRFDTPFSGNTSVDVEIEIPEKADLDLDLSVGDLKVEGIVGNKFLHVRIGDIHVVDAGHASDYSLVQAKTRIGDVDWHPRGDGHDQQSNKLDYGKSGWLGGKLNYSGNGKYELRAEVSVGDIHIN